MVLPDAESLLSAPVQQAWEPEAPIPDTTESVTTEPGTPLPAPVLTVDEAARLLPDMDFRPGGADTLRLEIMEGLSFELEYPNVGPTRDEADFCVSINRSGETRTSACAQSTEIGGVVSFMYLGDETSRPLAVLMVNSGLTLTPDVNACAAEWTASNPAAQLHACEVPEEISEVVYDASDDSVQIRFGVPFALPPE